MTNGLDHIGFNPVDYEKSKAFYIAALAPLGITVLQDYGVVIGMGSERPYLWIASSPKGGPKGPFPAETTAHVHLAFAATSRALVDAFYAAAIAAGGSDNGKPGLRTEYTDNYYAAFVLDPDGHNVEAVCHAPA